MKGKLRKIIAVLLILVTIALIAWIRPWADSEGASRLLYGNVDYRDVQLAFRAAGRLEAMLVDEGDSVLPGDVLARLDSQPATQALAVAQAQVAEARAQLDSVKAGLRPEEIQQARAMVRVAQAAFDNAERGATRQDALFKTTSTSMTAVDAAHESRDRTAAQLESANEALALAEAGARAEDIATAEAALSVALAREAQARTATTDMTLVAPSAGIVSIRAREPGSLLSLGQSVYALTLTDRVYVRAYIDEPRLNAAVPGATVSIKTDSDSRTYQGQIGYVSPQAEFTPKSVQTPELRTDLVYRLRIVVTDADDGLRQGMPVTIELQQ